MMVPAPQMAASEATIVAQKLCLDNSERSIALQCYNTHIISNKHRYLHIVTIACPPSQRCNRPLHSRHHNHVPPSESSVRPPTSRHRSFSLLLSMCHCAQEGCYNLISPHIESKGAGIEFCHFHYNELYISIGICFWERGLYRRES
jgi:hypothetical protein